MLPSRIVLIKSVCNIRDGRRGVAAQGLTILESARLSWDLMMMMNLLVLELQ